MSDRSPEDRYSKLLANLERAVIRMAAKRPMFPNDGLIEVRDGMWMEALREAVAAVDPPEPIPARAVTCIVCRLPLVQVSSDAEGQSFTCGCAILRREI